MKTILVSVNECRIIDVSQTVLSRYMFNVLHLVEEATRHEKWTHFPVPFIFWSFAVRRFCGFFFLTFVVNIYCFYSLNYSVARLGAGEAYWLIYIILHFVLGFIDLCWIKHERLMSQIIFWKTFLQWRRRSRFSYGELLKQRRRQRKR